ncbi:uncharacterized protein LOC131256855 isoform X2 [Magnolia sinica]|uniref:uncharacterized protein LOC131256855 isoform X2 n=1 Tax=Magnolia sinica TaxID=86752 RepID=UPI002657CA12|nr:uncharacterized protein LOC131256855 isoform X2 [Magnolia sinica]
MQEPASEIQDKILFMINNISASNMDVKAKEFTDVLKEQYYPWFAQYMVMKRASIEPNFHELYLKFLGKVNSRMLNKKIVKATYENCKTQTNEVQPELLQGIFKYLECSFVIRNVEQQFKYTEVLSTPLKNQPSTLFFNFHKKKCGCKHANDY